MNPAVVAEATGILPVDSQERFGFEALASAVGDPDDDTGSRRILRRLAWYTPSEALQLALFDSGLRSHLMDLATNPFLYPAAQHRIQGLLPRIEAAGVGADDEDIALSPAARRLSEPPDA